MLTTTNSQGAALMHNVISLLPSAVKTKVIAGVLFGDTKNQQSNSQISNYPVDQVAIWCAENDGVCWGRLALTAGHFVYMRDNTDISAFNYLKAKIEKALAGKAAVQN
jgi:cutinase